jgi:hypothetical protein
LTGVALVPPAAARASSGSDSPPPVAASSKLETETYAVEITSSGPYKSGATGTVKVLLTAKTGFHINGQYPYRFKAKVPTEGVTYPKPVLERADGKFEETTAVFVLPFVAGHPGKFDVGGVFHMSVCSPASCIVQKAPLEISIDVQ